MKASALRVFGFDRAKESGKRCKLASIPRISLDVRHKARVPIGAAIPAKEKRFRVVKADDVTRATAEPFRKSEFSHLSASRLLSRWRQPPFDKDQSSIDLTKVKLIVITYCYKSKILVTDRCGALLTETGLSRCPDAARQAIIP